MRHIKVSCKKFTVEQNEDDEETHILLVGVEEPEGEVTGLGGCSELTQ